MKTPLSWISLYAPLSELTNKNSLKSLAHEYSIHTAEIDGIEDHFIDKVVVGKVISCEKHAESKKLSIVEVAVGDDETTIILTGASNISEAKYVPVALVGAVLPGNFAIGERMMAGMMSRGMICGADEIGMSTEESTGIMILEQDWSEEFLETMVGKSFYDLTLPFPGKNGDTYRFPLRDATFEIDNKFITNRPDLFSVYGNAREWHTVFSVPFHEDSENAETDSGKNTFPLKIETEKCLAYNAWKMTDIAVGKSPWGIALMMERAGLAPKMDIVDITNCIMTELGQPMHAFDADKITGGITVRLAKKGEKLLALNGIEYSLTEEDMVIADDRGAVALAGVIGGMESAVSTETTSIIWESACFDPISVRVTAQRHGIRTDASTRYEKSLDPLLTTKVFPRVIEYMSFLSKKINIVESAHFLKTECINHIEIPVTYSFIDEKIGVKIPESEVNRILTDLGFTYTNSNKETIMVKVPSWRATKDISIKEDIAEEVGRVYGYDNVPLIPLGLTSFSISTKNTEKQLRDKTLAFFAHKKWSEVYNYSFSNELLDKKLKMTLSDEAVGIRNAFNEEYTHMRRTLAGRLLENIRDNSRYSDELRFFEIGNIYTKTGERNMNVTELLEEISALPYTEKKMLAGVAQGVTLETLRQDIEAYLESTLGYIPPLHQDDGSTLPFLHPGVTGTYKVGDIILVRFGQLHPGVAESYETLPGVLYFEIEYDTLLRLSLENDRVFHPISKFQTTRRELNFVVLEHTRTGDMAHHIAALHPWIDDVHVDSVYRDSEKLGHDKKSVNFAFTLTNTEGTISDADALEVQNNIIAHMAELGYNLRS